MSTKRESARTTSRTLVDVCNGIGGPLTLTSGAAESLIDAARFHRVAPLALSVLRQSAHPQLEALHDDRLRAIGIHLQACGALEQLASLLTGIDWVTFKGPVFSEVAHPVAGLRTYNDVDVLVAPDSLREVCRRLGTGGWQLADYRDMLCNQDTPGEMHWLSPGGVLVDLHWSMINMRSRRRLFEVPTAELLDRRVPITLARTQVWTLDPCDSLVHACLHAALSGANKLAYLVDVDRLSRRVTDWDEVVTRAKQWRAQVQVSLVLGRARRVLGTELPADLDSRLEVPRPVKGLLALTDRAVPVQHGRKNAGVAKFVARSVRAGTTGTARALSRNAARGLWARTSREPHDQVNRLPADEASLEVFLTAVEATVGRRVGVFQGTPPPG